MKKILSILIILFVSFGANAQTQLTFDQVKDAITTHHPSMKAIDASVNAIEASAKGAYSWMAPEFGAGFYETPYNPGKWKGNSAMPGMGMFMLSAEQMFPNKKAQDAEYNYLKSTADIEQIKKVGIANNLVTKARSAFYNLIINGRESQLIQNNKDLLDFMIKSAEIRYKNNLGSINSYYKLKAAVSKLHTRELVINAENTEQYAILKHLIQKDTLPQSIDTTFKWFDFTPYLVNQDQLTNNSDYQILNKAIAANHLKQQSEQASLKPQFGLKFDHMVAWGHQPQMFSLMAMMKLPIAKWSSREAKAKVEALNYQRESYKAQQQTFLIQETSKVRVLMAEMQGIKNELRMTEEQIIPALEKNFKTIQNSYEQNKAEILELSDAWQSLLDAQSDYLNALKRGMEVQSELLSVLQIDEL